MIIQHFAAMVISRAQNNWIQLEIGVDFWVLSFLLACDPCSGAILVLVFAKAFGIAWFAIGPVFAMAACKAITVGLSRCYSLRLAIRHRL